MASRCTPLKTPPRSAGSGGIPTPTGSVSLLRIPSATKSPVSILKSLSSAVLSPSLSFKSASGTRGLVTPESTALVEDNFEEISSGKVRKSVFVWRMLTVIFVAGMGLYLCMATISFSVNSRTQGSQGRSSWVPLSLGGEQKLQPPTIDSCPTLSEGAYPDKSSVCRHYPRPLAYSRSECACTPVHNFVILSMQRSGSGWFETLLNDHPNISSHGEIFSIRPRRQNFTTIKETLDRIYNLDWFSSAAKNSCTSAVGLKWMLNQGAMEYNREVTGYFQEKRVSIILLLRRNLLKRLISILANAYDRKEKQLNGAHKSHVHSEAEAKKLAEFKPTLNTKHLISNLQRVQEIADDALRVFNQTRLTLVYYEDVVRDRGILNTVQEFLGVELHELKSKQVKIHTKPLKDQVENWEDVERKLNGTEYYKFLTDSEYQ